MWIVMRPPLVRYGVAVGAAALALLLKRALDPLIGPGNAFLLCFASVTISAWYGGLGPGLLTTALAALAAGYAFSHPAPPAPVTAVGRDVRLGIFIAEGFLISVVSAAVGSARWRAEASAARLRASEQRYKSLFEKNPDAVFSLDLDGRFLSANPACERISGYSIPEILQASFGSFLVPEEREKTLERFHRGLQGERQNFETTITHKDGRRIELNVTAALIVVDDEVVGVYGICKEITERKRLEEELRQRAEALAAADRHKDEFLGMLAHELRNPLAPIRNCLELLRLRETDAPTMERVREVVERQVRHMARLVDDLLDVSRITCGKILLRYERLDLGRLIRDAARDHRHALEEAGPALLLELPEEPVWVVGDPTRVGQILDNLIQNAFKFTDPDGQVTVRMAADPAAYQATVTVRDTGIGIGPELLPYVFETFTQADRSLERSCGGLGLGLALVKQLVELHGGEARAESDGPGRGAAFTFWLPLDRQPAPSEAAAAPAVVAAGAQRVLVVEDNRDAAETLRELLELFGHTVEIAYSGPAGVEAAREFHPEVVLCDLGLPGMDGYAVAAELRRDPTTAATRLIAVSGYGQAEDRYRSQEAGFDVHLTKPVDMAELERLLTAGPASA
jgi:PAS domain S-box-containing protein